MRKTMVVTAFLLFAAMSVFAQQPSHPNAVSVFVSDLSFASGSGGTHFDASYGAAFDHMFSDRFSGGVSVTSQRFRQSIFSVSPTGLPVSSTFTQTIYPIDANVSYHFFTGSRWKPYAGVGVRYVSETFHGSGALGSDHFSTHSVDPEVSAGVVFQFRPNLGLRLEAKQIVSDNSGALHGDPTFKGSVGLSFRF